MKKMLLFFIFGIFCFYLHSKDNLMTYRIYLDMVFENTDNIYLSKSLENNDLLITYVDINLNGFYKVLDSDGLLKYSDKLPGESPSFYVTNNILFKNLEYVIEISPINGEVLRTYKTRYMFAPDFDDTDKSKRKYKYWLTKDNYLGINNYSNDGSFTYTMKKLKILENAQILGVTNGYSSKEIFLLKMIDINKIDIINYEIKNHKQKELISFTTNMQNIEHGKISLSPDGKKIIVLLSDGIKTEIIYYNLYNQEQDSFMLEYSNVLSIDWAFNSSYFLLMKPTEKILYRVEISE